MYNTTHMKRYLLGICSVNEGPKILRVLEKFNDYNCYDVLIIDDGSTDGSLDNIKDNFPVTVVRNNLTMGAGFGTRQIHEYALQKGYEGIFLVSGNDKDRPEDIAKFVDALKDGYDFIQGSRYLPGGAFGNMPFYRKIATRYVHPWLFSLLARRRITDSTNGFRAVRSSILNDKRLDLNQPWLDEYELEPYIFYKVIKLGYKVTEVPVSKIYPPKQEGYTKMKPFSGWWSILRPIVYLLFGIRK